MKRQAGLIVITEPVPKFSSACFFRLFCCYFLYSLKTHMYPMYVALNEVTLQTGAWMMVYAEHVPRRQQFHVARSM